MEWKDYFKKQKQISVVIMQITRVMCLVYFIFLSYPLALLFIFRSKCVSLPEIHFRLSRWSRSVFLHELNWTRMEEAVSRSAVGV